MKVWVVVGAAAGFIVGALIVMALYNLAGAAA